MSNANDKENGKGNLDRDDATQSTDIEAEIRRGRKFDLGEAVGRAGAGNLKGGSPVAPTQQLLLDIDELLNRNLTDNDGSLIRTILARLTGNPPLLARHFGDPAGALQSFLGDILDSPANLADLVRQTDACWGREYGERPIFEREGQPADPNDPYTVEGVRTALNRLRQTLNPE